MQVLAPAKINLTLHVTGQRSDGYHLLDSLVVFAAAGDRLTLRVAGQTSLEVNGPEGAVVPVGDDNLVLRAAALFDDAPGVAFLLDKHLPTASGIGGGSADAAAAYRGMMTLLSGESDVSMFAPARSRFAEQLVALGADIPVCLQSGTTRMRGVGEQLDPLAEVPTLYAILVNPRVAVSTPDVFAALPCKNNPPMALELPAFTGVHGLVDWLGDQRNDLQDPACHLVPEIRDVLDALEQDDACLLARMSGSGATCFGLYASREEAVQGAHDVAEENPDWWVCATKLGGMGEACLPVVATAENGAVS